MHQPHQYADRRRLSRAIRTNEPHDLTRLEFQRDVVEREVTVLLPDTFHSNDGIHHDFSFAVMLSLTSRRRLSSSLGLTPSSIDSRATCSRCFCSSSCCSFSPMPAVAVTRDPLPCWVIITPSRSSSR